MTDSFNPFDVSQYVEPTQVFKQIGFYEAPAQARGDFQPKPGAMDYVWDLEPVSFRMKGAENRWRENMSKSTSSQGKIAKFAPPYAKAIKEATGVALNSIEDAATAGNGLYFEVSERAMGKGDRAGKYRHVIRVVPAAEAEALASSVTGIAAPVIPTAPAGAADEALLALIGEGMTHADLKKAASTADLSQAVKGTLIAGIVNKSLLSRLVDEGRVVQDGDIYKAA